MCVYSLFRLAVCIFLLLFIYLPFFRRLATELPDPELRRTLWVSEVNFWCMRPSAPVRIFELCHIYAWMCRSMLNTPVAMTQYAQTVFCHYEICMPDVVLDVPRNSQTTVTSSLPHTHTHTHTHTYTHTHETHTH